MHPRNLALVLLVVAVFPVVASAGPIEFGLAPGWPTYTNPNPGADAALVPIQTPGPVAAFDPVTGMPVGVAVLGFDPRQLPTSPAWSTTRPDGTVHWDVNGYYALPLSVIDYASGEFATFTFYGRAHMVADYAPATGWIGSANFSSQDWHQARLGGNLYTVWGTDSPGTAAVDVWVGTGVPPTALYTPEPGTLALAALGLVPLGLRRRRR